MQRVDEHEPRRSVRAARLCADAVFFDNLEGVVPVKTGILGLVISELLLAQRHKVGCAESSRSFEPVVESEQQQARCSSFFTGVTTACGVKSTDEDTAFSIVFVVFQARLTPHFCTGGVVDTRFDRWLLHIGSALMDTVVLVRRGYRDRFCVRVFLLVRRRVAAKQSENGDHADLRQFNQPLMVPWSNVT